MELNGARERVGLPPLDARARRDLARAGAGGDLPPARVPAQRRAWPGVTRDRAAAVGAAVRRGGAAAGRRRRSCWWRRARRRTRSSGCCARRSRGSRTSRCGCWPPRTGARPPRPLDGAGERAARRLGLLRADDAALRRRGLPRRPRHAWRARWRAACRWSRAPTRATWPRTRPACAGPGWACRCRAASTTPRGVRLAVRRVLGRARATARRAERAARLGDPPRRAPARPPTRSRSSPNRTKIRKERGDCVGGP